MKQDLNQEVKKDLIKLNKDVFFNMLRGRKGDFDFITGLIIALLSLIVIIIIILEVKNGPIRKILRALWDKMIFW